MITLLCIGASVNAQTKDFTLFGSYNYGFGNLTGTVSSELRYPESTETNKLRAGIVNQFEIGAYYHSLGLGVIHNEYAVDASTAFENADINGDMLLENGILSDNLRLKFTGLEILYKIPFFNKFYVNWKYAVGLQSYSIDKRTQFLGTTPSDNKQTITGSIYTSLFGVEINYNIWKMINLGIETSLIPGSYKNLKSQDSDYIYNDNVSRLSTVLKLTVNI